MTPEQKAAELVNKFFEFNHRVKWDSDNDEWIHNYDQAKQCALIAVDEILKVTEPYLNRHEPDYLELPSEMTQGYWLEVKQEIEKL